MTTMIEKMAIALWQAESVRATEKPRREPWEDQDKTTRERWRFMARAALLALREPSEGMIAEALDESSPPDYVTTVWQTMIDAALNEAS